MAIYYFELLPHGVRRNGEKLNTKMHAEYITRQGAYEKIKDREEDFVYRSFGNIPSWANTDLSFWDAAEENRRKNGRAYREIRLGLQEEFTLEENVKVIEKFLAESGIKDNHAYSYAIHDKKSMFSNEHRNIHAHIMFSEKVIEKNRELGPDQYFKRYTIQPDGRVIGGYKSERSWIKKDRLYELRKIWANIVNEKFEEKELDIQISEKTLVEQKEDLLHKGKIEEAELFDREPEPHLGSKIKKPKTREVIHELIRTVDYVYTEDDDTTEDSNSDKFEDQRELEEKIKKINNKHQLELVLFAYDVVIRKTAKELQKEQLALHAKQAMQKEMDRQNQDGAEEAFEITNNPMVITVGDVLKRIDEKMEMEAIKAKEAQVKLEAVTPLIKSKKEIHKNVFDIVTDGKYSKLHKAYLDSYKEVRLLKHAFKTTQVSNFEEYKKRLHEITTAERKKQELSNSCRELHNKLQTTLCFTKERHMNDLINENTSNIELRNRLETAVKTHRKNHQFYYNKNKILFDERPDRVLFAEKLPTEVSLFNKLEGKIPLRELEKVISFKQFNNGKSIKEQYVIIPNSKKQIDGKTTVQAIKINDVTFQGKASIYNVEIMQAQTKQNIPYVKVGAVEKTKGMVRLYEYREYKKSGAKKMERVVNKNKTVNTAKQYGSVSERVKQKTLGVLNAIIDELSKQENIGKIDNLWYENDYSRSEKTEFEKTEDRIKRGWSL